MATGPLPRKYLRPPPTPTIAELLDDELTQFDNLMHDVRGGIRSADHFDRLEEKASAIASNIRDAFRRGRVAQG